MRIAALILYKKLGYFASDRADHARKNANVWSDGHVGIHMCCLKFSRGKNTISSVWHLIFIYFHIVCPWLHGFEDLRTDVTQQHTTEYHSSSIIRVEVVVTMI